MKNSGWAWDKCGVASAGIVLVASLLAGCGSGREVEVKGEVTAPATLAVQGMIIVDFLDVTGDGDSKAEVVRSVELDAPGSFAEKVSLEGDRVIVRAIDDADGDGACTAGEAWAEAQADVATDDTVEPVTLTLSNAPCPASTGGG
ncbi:MAG TPA: hypothetical protein VGP93_08210 [Polyangiaceae bacterium]|nr:hypothetical protein [Polyangiaceae bacterium]